MNSSNALGMHTGYPTNLPTSFKVWHIESVRTPQHYRVVVPGILGCFKQHCVYNGQHSDIWAVAICMFAIVVGRFPCNHSNLIQFAKTSQGANSGLSIMSILSRDTLNSLSTFQKDLLTQMLMLDPSARPVLSDVVQHDLFGRRQLSPLPTKVKTCITPNEKARRSTCSHLICKKPLPTKSLNCLSR